MISHLSLLIIVTSLLSPNHCLSREEFYPYGGIEDEVLDRSDNASSLINLPENITLFSTSYTSLYVSGEYVF